MSPDGPPISENMQQTLDAIDTIMQQGQQACIVVVAKTLGITEDEASVFLHAAIVSGARRDTFEEALQATFTMGLQLGENRGYARAVENMARGGSDR